VKNFIVVFILRQFLKWSIKRMLYAIVSLFVTIAIIRYVRLSMIAGKTRILHIQTTELRRFTRWRAAVRHDGRRSANHESPRPNPCRQQNISPLDYTGLPIG